MAALPTLRSTNIFSSSDPSHASNVQEVARPFFDYDNPDAFEYYQYEPLQPGWIRLIHLVDGDFETWGEYEFKVNDLELQILHFPLETAPPFDALSYCWGPTSMQAAEEARAQIFTSVERCYPIRCNGGFVRATKSLREALWAVHFHSRPEAQDVWRSARGVSRSVWLWADGICLNQDDDRDKAQGIAMMSDIYLKASTVIIWLGQQDESTLPAFQTWVALSNVATTRKFSRLDIEDFYDDSLWGESGNRRPTELDWCHWAMLYTRSWWHRSWVVQEAGLAGRKHNIVLCGLQTLTLQNFSTGARVMQQGHWACEVMKLLKNYKQQFPLIADDDCRYNALVGYDMSGGRWPWQYVELLWRVRSNNNRLKLHQMFEVYLSHTQCKDSRDKIHAMRGLAAEFENVRPEDLSTDPNVAPAELFCQAARLILRKNRNLRILFAPIDRFLDGQRNDFQLPSWCPNFNAGPIRRGMLSQDDGIGRTHATGMTVYAPQESGHWTKLILEGYRIDVVRALSSSDKPRNHSFFKSWAVTSSIFKVVEYLTEARVSVDALHNLSEEVALWFVQKKYTCFASRNYVDNLWCVLSRGTWILTDGTDIPYATSDHAELLAEFVTRELRFGIDKRGQDADHQRTDGWSNCRGHRGHSRHGFENVGPSSSRLDHESFTSFIESVRQIDRYDRLSRRMINAQWSDPEDLEEDEISSHLPNVDYLEEEVLWNTTYTDCPDTRSFMESLRLNVRRSCGLGDETLHARVDGLVTHSLRGRVVYGTDGLNIGIGPDDMQVEDEVWLLAGGSVPYILRPLPNGNYHFLGESYMYGVMQGEAWPADPSKLVRVVLE